jgi:hypothetical protein
MAYLDHTFHSGSAMVVDWGNEQYNLYPSSPTTPAAFAWAVVYHLDIDFQATFVLKIEVVNSRPAQLQLC